MIEIELLKAGNELSGSSLCVFGQSEKNMLEMIDATNHGLSPSALFGFL